MTEPCTNGAESDENISEVVDLVNEIDENGSKGDIKSVSVPVSAVSHVTSIEAPVTAIPVSTIPVASLISVGNGETYNVISSDQIQLTSNGEFLCVNSACGRGIKADAWHTLVQTEPSDLNTAHIVIQNGTDVDATVNNQSGGEKVLTYSYEEAVNMPVLHVRCKNTNAELYKHKFGSGNRGRCIKFDNQFFTPSEFEAICGRAQSKDWKRSIRFGGRSLQCLIQEQILIPHATSCTCSSCCDDLSAIGPVRLYTPYKRKKKSYKPSKKKASEGGNTSNEDEDSCDSNSDKADTWTANREEEQVVINNEPAETAAATNSIAVNTTEDEEAARNNDIDAAFKKLKEMSSKMMKLAYSVNSMIKEMESKWQRTDQSSEYITCDITNDQDMSSPLTIDDSTISLGLEPRAEKSRTSKKCANCNREAFAECSTCRQTPYCSTFCQRKDWASHQIQCARTQSGLLLEVINK